MSPDIALLWRLEAKRCRRLAEIATEDALKARWEALAEECDALAMVLEPRMRGPRAAAGTP